MTSFALSLVLLFVVFGVLGGWAFREDRRRRADRAEER
jgi:cbb3-type cytochrome oxidase subunit 3